jgi:hypothetical protein
MAHLQIPGSLAISTCDYGPVNMANDVMQLASETCDRPGSLTNTLVAAPTYYIRAKYDINSQIQFNSGGNDPTAVSNDDSWYIPTAFTVCDQNTAANDVTYNIGAGPATDTDTQAIATLTANDDFGRTCDSTVSLKLDMSAGGVLTSAVTTSYESGHNGIASEDTTLHTIAYWPNSDTAVTNQTSPNGQTGDVSQVPLLRATFETYFNDQILAVNNQFNDKQIVESWSITVDKLDPAPDSVLSVFGHSNDTSSTGDLFSAGERVVLATAKNLSYAINNENGNTLTLFTNRDVYGVLEQSA